MRRFLVNFGSILVVLFTLNSSHAASLRYLDNAELNRQLRNIARAHRDSARVDTLATTPARHEVRFLELGAGNTDARRERPAILVVAGIEGNDLAGSVSAVHWAERLLESAETNESMRTLLETKTIYVVPRANPDAIASAFQKPRRETTVSVLPKVDDDHDGMSDEDGPEDLNGDDLITSMRVEDPEGDYILDPSEPRLLLKADRAKGEKGQWRLLVEGRDNDQDEEWNEDGPGGVNYNRNFPYGYRFFAPWSGIHQMSETVTRALAEFVVERPQIAVVFTFGAADNLTQTPKGDAPKRPPTGLHEGDLPVYRELGKIWREALGLKKELGGASEPGTFSDWMYFHRGRLSLAARPWSPALALEIAKVKGPKKQDEKNEKADDNKNEEADDNKDEKDDKTEENRSKTEEKKSEKPQSDAPDRKQSGSDNRNEEERNFLKWVDEHAAEGFLPWNEIEHPDFPGRKVEVGGFAPYVKSNPPEPFLDDLAGKHAKFLDQLLLKLPSLAIRKAQAKHLGDSVFEVRVELENSGYLPTALEQGEAAREVPPIRVVIDVEPPQILSGTRTTTVATIPGSGGMREVRYIILAKDRDALTLEAVSTFSGIVKTNITLDRSVR